MDCRLQQKKTAFRLWGYDHKTVQFYRSPAEFCFDIGSSETNGVIYIRRRDGDTFFVKPSTTEKSPLDITGVDLQATGDEIVESVREGRKRFGLSRVGLTALSADPISVLSRHRFA